MSTFLNEDEIVKLTGRKMKSLQVVQLHEMKIPYRVNATGHPVVTRSAVEGSKEISVQAKNTWIPHVLRSA